MRMALILVSVCAGVQAQEQVFPLWAGNGSNLWSVASNWDPAGVPDNTINFTYGPIIDGGNGLAIVDINVTIDKVGVGATSQLSIANGKTLTIRGETDPKDGSTGIFSVLNTATMVSTGGSTRIRMIEPGQLTIGNIFDLPCQLVMSDSTNNRIVGNGDAGQTFAVDHSCTVTGAGTIGADLEVWNLGVIEASQPSGITLNPGEGNSVDNDGTLRAVNGSTLRLEDALIDNEGGVIEAQEGSLVTLRNQPIFVTGGTLRSIGSGRVRDITVDGATNLIDVTIEGVYEVRNQAETRLAGTINNTGVIDVASTGGTTELRANGLVMLTGGGAVSLSDFTNNRMTGVGADPLLVNVDNTIQGSGTLGASMELENHGLIESNLTTGMTINVDSALVNTGTIRASNGAPLSIKESAVDNTGGVIEALDGSTVFVYDQPVSITGGLLRTEGTGRIADMTTTGDVQLIDLTIDGTYEVLNQGNTQLHGTIENLGTIVLGSTGSTTELRPWTIDGATLTGGGVVDMGDVSTNHLTGPDGAVFVNMDNTFVGSGRIGLNDISVINHGTFTNDSSTDRLIDMPDDGIFDNQGLIDVAGPGELHILRGGFTTSGDVIVRTGTALRRPNTNVSDYTQTGGSTTVHGTLEVQPGNLVTLEGGALAGTGVMIGDVHNLAGVVSPGPGVSTLSVQGDLTIETTGASRVELSDDGTLAADLISVSGAAALAGTLEIQLVEGTVPDPQDQVVVLSASEITGEFEQVVTPDGLDVMVTYTETEVIVQAACAADCSLDGQLNILDFVCFQGLFQAGDPDADCNGDGQLNILDFVCFQTLIQGGCS